MQALLEQLPVVSLAAVWHVGSFDAAHKGCDGPSYEGNGLSISLHPEEWTAIAMLRGQPTWKLRRKGGRFLSFRELQVPQQEALRPWGLQHGWLQMQTRWVLSSLDEDSEGHVRVMFDSAELAQAEREEVETWAKDARVAEKLLVCTTHAMHDRLAFKTDDDKALDIASKQMLSA